MLFQLFYPRTLVRSIDSPTNIYVSLFMQKFDYTQCTFEARLSKPRVFRRQQFYLYVSKDFLIINQEPYSAVPDIKLELKPTTHVKWLWDHRGGKRNLRGFVIETENYVNEFVAERIVLQHLKFSFSKFVFQSQFHDEYDLNQYLDKGNYAQVFVCIRKSDKHRCAVKIMEKEKIRSITNGKESVFNELKILRALDHPNLLKLYEVFEDRQKYYFVMELLEGITLYKEIAKRNKKEETELQPQEIRSITRQILSGLDYLASKNIMHRDIKPQNINYAFKGKIDVGLKLVDYGLATFQSDPVIIFTKCGTPGYVAPEIIVYDAATQPFYNVSVDIFSVGVILHIMLAKEPAFPGKSRNTILNKNKEAKFDFKSKKYENIASDGIDLLSKMLEKDPLKRITAKQALQHPFLTKDKPIFKFKKSLHQQDDKMVQMKVLKNLEQISKEQGSHQQPQSQFQRNHNPYTWFSYPPTHPVEPSVRKQYRTIFSSDNPSEQKHIDFLNYET